MGKKNPCLKRASRSKIASNQVEHLRPRRLDNGRRTHWTWHTIKGPAMSRMVGARGGSGHVSPYQGHVKELETLRYGKETRDGYEGAEEQLLLLVRCSVGLDFFLEARLGLDFWLTCKLPKIFQIKASSFHA
ncbi:hypothetical protein Syun_025530 [Stephania yunnanensis]|uniref:Uncharacterized protein n=1 Tax=Stephania yunnanensis TaxID=152371 RepID=A0AAP0ERU0_9MAGN